MIRTSICAAALLVWCSSAASAAVLSVRAGDASHSTTLTLGLGETAAIDILVQLEAGEVLGFANVFPSVGPLEEGPEFFEAIDFLSDWDPDEAEHVGHAIIISRAEGSEFAFDFGQGIFWNQYVMIFTADGVAGPGEFLLERLVIHGFAEGTALLRLNGTLTELFTPDNQRLTHTFATPALRVTVLKQEDGNSNMNDNSAANDNVPVDNGNDNAVVNDNATANDNSAGNDNSVAGNDNDVHTNDNVAANDNSVPANDNAADNDNDDDGNDNEVDDNDNDDDRENDNGVTGGGNTNGNTSGGNDNRGGTPPTPFRLCGANAAASLSLALAGLASMRLFGRRRRT